MLLVLRACGERAKWLGCSVSLKKAQQKKQAYIPTAEARGRDIADCVIFVIVVLGEGKGMAARCSYFGRHHGMISTRSRITLKVF